VQYDFAQLGHPSNPSVHPAGCGVGDGELVAAVGIEVGECVNTV